MPCILPMTQMVIRPDGKVGLCCNDALGKHTMGDCGTENLTDIWKSPKYTDIRKVLSKDRCDGPELCKNCDTFTLG